MVCGTIEEPSSDVQDELATLLNEHTALKRWISDTQLHLSDEDTEAWFVSLLADTQEETTVAE